MPYNSLIDRSDAGALIPEEESRILLDQVYSTSVALQLFRRVRMSRKQQRMPVLASLPTAYWVDGDTGLKQTTEMAWSNKYLNAEELAVIVPIPEVVLDDAEFDIWGEVRPALVEAVGIAIDAAVFFGTNKPVSWPDSIEDGAAAAGHTVIEGASAVDIADDINNVMAFVEADGYAVDMFAAPATLKATLRGLRDANNGLLFNPSLQAGTPGTLYGEPILYMTSGYWDSARARLIAGQRNQVIMAVRDDFTWKILDQAVIQDNTGAIIYNLAQQDMVALRVTFRVAYQIANTINRLNTNAATRYPFAVLRPTGFV